MAKSPGRTPKGVAMATAGRRIHPSEDMGTFSVGYGGAGPSKASYMHEDLMRTQNLSLTSPSMTLEQARYSSMRKKIGLSRIPHATCEQTVDFDRAQADLIQFVKEHFHMKECKLFVPKPGQKKPMKVQDLKCRCGEVVTNHAGLRYKRVEDIASSYIIPKEYCGIVARPNDEVPDELPQVEWSAQKNIHTSTTNGFGKITFNVEQIGGTKPAKYVRLADTDSVEDAMELMKTHWHIQDPMPPKLVISAIGGAKNFRLDGRMRETFSNGLIKAAKTTSAWLITSGFNMGVMKAVGMAVNEGQTFQYDKDRMTHVLRCIGIAPWGYVKGRNYLESEDGQPKFNAYYRTSNTILHLQPVPLNADHTHFIFVDNGLRNSYGGVAEFRSKLEALITRPESAGGLGIPVVLVLVEGGYDAILDTRHSLEQNIPVVVCAGTGRGADILAFAYNHSSKSKEGVTINQRHQNMLRKKLKNAYGKSWASSGDPEKKCDEFVEHVCQCVRRENMMHIFHMNKHEDLDLAILSVLLKADASEMGPERRMHQLNLAMTWNRADIAQAEIFREDINWEQEELHEVLTKALIQNKVDFVKLILKQGVAMKEYLTLPRLEELYNEASKNTYLKGLLKIPKDATVRMAQVSAFLREILDKYDDEKTSLSQNKWTRSRTKSMAKALQSETDVEERVSKEGFRRPYKQLLTWAILVNRLDMALFFWEMGEEPITSAIAASRICGSVSGLIPKFESAIRETFAKSKTMFEDLAVKVLDECHHMDPEKAMMLVERKSPMWSKMTCLQMAASANDQAFLASVACQNSINTVWKRGILSPWQKVGFGVMCPMFIPFLNFTSMGDATFSVWRRIRTFYSAPITKYSQYLLWYFLFVLLYVYMILVDFKETPAITEWCCIFWIFTFLINDFHTFLAFPSPTFYGKIRDWFGLLERLEFINVLAVLIAFVVRWWPEHLFVAKTIYCINAVVFILGIMKMYTANSHLGPKLYMIIRMLSELSLFLMVLAVFLLAYGVASQGLMYPRRDRDWVILKDILYYPYWQLYGEIFLEEIESDTSCQASEAAMNVTGVLASNCRTFHWLVPILLCAYLLVGNVLLLNLLIAIFSHVFELVEKNSVEIWKYQMYFLVMEFDVKVAMFPPFSIIAHIFLTLKWIFRNTCCKKKTEVMQFQRHHLLYLQLFEKEMMANYLRNSKASVMDSLQGKISQLQKRVDELTNVIEDELLIDQTQVDYEGTTTMPATLISKAGSGPTTTIPPSTLAPSWPPLEDLLKLKKVEEEKEREAEEEKLMEAEKREQHSDDGEEDASKKKKKKKKKKKHREKEEQEADKDVDKLNFNILSGDAKPDTEKEINSPATQQQPSLADLLPLAQGRQTPAPLPMPLRTPTPSQDVSEYYDSRPSSAAYQRYRPVPWQYSLNIGARQRRQQYQDESESETESQAAGVSVRQGYQQRRMFSELEERLNHLERANRRQMRQDKKKLEKKLKQRREPSPSDSNN